MPEKLNEKNLNPREEAIGCGCVTVGIALLGPVFTNLLGLTAWPIPAILVLLLVVTYLKRQPSGQLSWTTIMSLLGFGTALSALWAVIIFAGSDEKVDEVQTQEIAAVAPSRTPEAVADEGPISNAPAVEEAEPTRMTVDDISALFEENQVAGADYFSSRTVVIPATVVRVREALGTGILVVKSRSNGGETEMGFSEAGTRNLISLRRSDRVEATCPKIWEVMGEVIITCTSVKKM